MSLVFKKIKGSILQYAVVASILIFFLLLSLVLLTHIQSYFRLQSTSLITQIADVNGAIDKTLNSDFNSISNKNDSVQIEQGYLGAFKKVAASTQMKGSTYTKSALIGAPISNQTLYLEDTNKPLVLVGNTNIKGNAFLPVYGVKAGVIAGTYFSGKNLLNDPAEISNSSLPELDDKFRDYASSLLNKSFLENKTFSDLKEEMKNSFNNETVYVYESSKITNGENLIGNVLVKSDSEIRITQNANSTEATFVAPIVKINDGFKGTVHIVASDSIIIGRNVVLDYPSSLVISERKNDVAQSFSSIEISEESEINGNIIYLKNTIHKKQDTNIYIANKAVVNGGVYCEGNLELAGTIKGTVYTHQFLARAKGNNYVNHILDGTLIPIDTEVQWNGLPLKEEKKGVVKWLY